MIFKMRIVCKTKAKDCLKYRILIDKTIDNN